MILKAPPTANYEEQAAFFKAVAHPARLAILDSLRNGEECVCHMEATLGYRQSYLSQQLAVLRKAGIVEVRRDGWNIFYKVILPEVFELLDAAAIALGTPFARREKRIQNDQCPCPQCRKD